MRREFWYVMTILVLGLNHKTAPVAVREKVAFSDEKQRSALQQIEEELVDSAVILSTCNRTEVYFHNKSVDPIHAGAWTSKCKQWFASFHQLPLEVLTPNLYAHQNQSAVFHLMKVACGLDSLILGEPQILGQVKQAYQVSEAYYQSQQRMISTELSRLFQRTFSTAKRVRTETQIGESAVSVAYAACCLARDLFTSLGQLSILLVGAGETIELVCRHLLRHGVRKVLLANRTLARAEALVQKLGAEQQVEVLSLEQLQQGLACADIVISSTASNQVLITKDMVEQAQQERQNEPLLLVDIAVPRDIDEFVREVENVHHYTIDDLQHIIQHNLTEREKAAKQATQIIQQECDDFFEWLKVHQFSDLIKRYRQQAEKIRYDLLQRALLSLEQGESAEQVLQELSYKLTNKLLHSPTQVMNEMVRNDNTTGLALFSGFVNQDK